MIEKNTMAISNEFSALKNRIMAGNEDFKNNYLNFGGQFQPGQIITTISKPNNSGKKPPAHNKAKSQSKPSQLAQFEKNANGQMRSSKMNQDISSTSLPRLTSIDSQMKMESLLQT